MNHKFRSGSVHTLVVISSNSCHVCCGVNQCQVETLHVHCDAPCCRNGHFACVKLFSPQPPLGSWTWLYRQKANETYGNIVNYSHTSRIHFSTNNTPFRPFKRTGCKCRITVDKTTSGFNSTINTWFAARKSIFTRDSIYAIARIYHGNSVCPSVCHTGDQSKTVEARITQFSPYSSPIPLVFRG